MEFKGLGKESAKMLWNKVKTKLFNKSVTDVEISGRTVTITKGDGSTSTQTTQDTTYGVVSKSANGLAPKLPNETSTTKYLRQDGTWVAPPNDNTTYSDATQTNHGLLSAADKKKLDEVEAGALQILKECYVEDSFNEAGPCDSFQFVRNGYFCIDSKDSTPENLVFNRIVSLKSSYVLPK